MNKVPLGYSFPSWGMSVDEHWEWCESEYRETVELELGRPTMVVEER
jgi:hypothetical protein